MVRFGTKRVPPRRDRRGWTVESRESMLFRLFNVQLHPGFPRGHNNNNDNNITKKNRDGVSVFDIFLLSKIMVLKNIISTTLYVNLLVARLHAVFNTPLLSRFDVDKLERFFELFVRFGYSTLRLYSS